MVGISPKVYTAIVLILVLFLISTGTAYVGILSWMAMNGIEATGTAFQKLELFVVANVGLLIGTIFKPTK